MTSLAARSVSLAEFRAAPCAILGGAIDSGEVVLIGSDPITEDETESRPLAVLLSYDLWQRLGGEVDEPTADDVEPTTEPEAAQQDATTASPAPAAPVPVAGQLGLWCCAEPGCSGVTDEPGGKCGAHDEEAGD